jgi:uncharacterized protein (DUF1330 family)
MRQYLGLGIGLVAGALIGAAGVSTINAQGKTPVYYIGEIDVKDSDAYAKEYAPKAQAVIKAHGGRFLALGGSGGASKKIMTLEGTPPKRAVVQVWDSMEQFQAWRDDPKFKEAREIGMKYATFRSYVIEGTGQ